MSADDSTSETKAKAPGSQEVAVIGGGNSKSLKDAPEGCILGANSHALLGGYAVWDAEWAGAATEL
jgi:hypothetical protein